MEKRCYGCMKLKQESPVCEHCGFDETAENPSHQLPLGTALKEQYLIGKALGQGGFGITYLGWDLYLDLPVAIKEYYPSGLVMRDSTASTEVIGCGGDTLARFTNNKERFLREAKMLARFSQVPQIVQIRNFFLANNTAYIVMEYVDGITLKQYVKDQGGKISPEETFAILDPVMEAMDKVHQAGLVHRDISPDNIMMLPNGGAKLLDFGAGRDVGSAMVGKNLTSSTEAILKPGYAPIEQYQKRGNLGPWTDVYAMCGTIYFCLTGEVPPDAPERMLEYEETLFAEVAGLTDSQRDALERGIALRTEQRTGNMEQLRQELKRAEPEPVEVPEEKPEPKPVPEKQPKKEPEEKPAPAPREKTTREPKTRTASVRKSPEKKQPTDAPTIQVSRKEEKKEPVAPAPEEKTPVRREKPKKKKFPMLLAAVAVVAIIAVGAVMFLSGEEEIVVPFVDRKVSGGCGNSAVWTLNLDRGELVITGSGSMTAYASPENAYTPWQPYREQIRSVTVTDSVTAIGAYSFAGIENLKTVTIGPNVLTIARGAFQGSGVETVNFATEEDGSTALTTIAMDAFRETALKEIILPDSVKTIASGAFAGCDELVMAQLGENTIPSFASWDDGVFQDVSEEFVLHCTDCTPASEYAELMGIPVKKLDYATWEVTGWCGDNMYYNINPDAGFMKITGVGDMWDYIEENEQTAWSTKETPPWLKYAPNIRVLIIEDGVSSIGEYAFQHFTELDYVHWGTGLKTISTQAFLDSGLKKIVLPENVTEIERYAFTWNRNLESVRLPENLRILRQHTFNRCYALREFFIGGKTQVEYGTYTPFNQNYEGERDLPKSLTIYSLPKSPAEAFAAKFGFKFSVGARGMVPEESGQIGDNAWWFRNGENLVLYGSGATWKYNLSQEDIETWAKWDHQAGKAFTSHPDFWKNQIEVRNIIILPGLEELGNGLFEDMTNVRTIDCGTVKRWYAHCSWNSQIKELVFPETLQVLGSWSFASCSALETVTFLGNTTIEERAFNNCFSLRDIYFQGKNIQFRGDPFSTEGTDLVKLWPNLVFHVHKYSAAEQYAQKTGFTHLYLE